MKALETFNAKRKCSLLAQLLGIEIDNEKAYAPKGFVFTATQTSIVEFETYKDLFEILRKGVEVEW